MFVYREEYYLDRKEPSPDKAEEYAQWQAEMENVHGTAEVLIAKQRHGPTGTAKLAFEGKYTRFSDLEDHAADYPDYG
jgi:replicative DNA helicase